VLLKMGLTIDGTTQKRKGIPSFYRQNPIPVLYHRQPRTRALSKFLRCHSNLIDTVHVRRARILDAILRITIRTGHSRGCVAPHSNNANNGGMIEAKIGKWFMLKNIARHQE
jgi:hypothetical protein